MFAALVTITVAVQLVALWAVRNARVVRDPMGNALYVDLSWLPSLYISEAILVIFWILWIWRAKHRQQP